jgi:hypothetical protein
MLDQASDVSRGGVLRRLGELCPLGRCELSLEVIEHEVEHVALTRICPLIFAGFFTWRWHSAEDS